MKGHKTRRGVPVMQTEIISPHLSRDKTRFKRVASAMKITVNPLI